MEKGLGKMIVGAIVCVAGLAIGRSMQMAGYAKIDGEDNFVTRMMPTILTMSVDAAKNLMIATIILLIVGFLLMLWGRQQLD